MDSHDCIGFDNGLAPKGAKALSEPIPSGTEKYLYATMHPITLHKIVNVADI